jgi:hypothetical protein
VECTTTDPNSTQALELKQLRRIRRIENACSPGHKTSKTGVLTANMDLDEMALKKL